MPTADDYEYDVFISYRSGYVDPDATIPLPTRTWTRDVFACELRKWLTAEVGLSRVFVERDEVGPGARWPEDVARKLLRSKVLLAVLDATYRRSDWCMSELQSMLSREQALGVGPSAEEALVLPIHFSDGEQYPEEVLARTPVDLRRYASLSPSFSGSERYLDLVEHVRGICRMIGGRVRNPPPWNRKWPIIRAVPHDRPPFAKPEL